MPLYFFHLRNKVVDVEDEEGVFLPSLEKAREVALRAARDTLCQDMRTGVLDLRFRIEVTNAAGKVVHTIRLAEAFTVIGEGVAESD